MYTLNEIIGPDTAMSSWKEARELKDYKLADKIKNKAKELGWILENSNQGIRAYRQKDKDDFHSVNKYFGHLNIPLSIFISYNYLPE